MDSSTHTPPLNPPMAKPGQPNIDPHQVADEMIQQALSSKPQGIPNSGVPSLTPPAGSPPPSGSAPQSGMPPQETSKLGGLKNIPKKVIFGVVALAILLTGGLGVGLYLGTQQQDTRQQAHYDPASNSYCDWCAGGGTDPSMWGGCPNQPTKVPQSLCSNEYCCLGYRQGDSGGGGGGGGGGTPNKCSNTSPTPAHCRDASPGKVVAYSGGTCTCQFTTGGNCGCVPTGGTLCQLGAVNPDLTGDCLNKSVSASCTRDNKIGTCQSDGTSDNQLRCACNLAPVQPTPTPVGGTTPSCTRRSDCPVGKYCSSGTCQSQATNNSIVTCVSGENHTANDMCLSGNCVNGTCQAAGNTAPGACQDDTGCSANQYCDLGTCRADKAVGGDCTRASMCSTNACYSLRCREVVDDSNPTASCISGKVYCGSGVGCNTAGWGKMCNNGSIPSDSSSCTEYDACATSSQSVSENQSCQGLTQLSTGESNKGKFVGCSGAQNCFCSSLDSSSTVQCYPDEGNDSCGAGTAPTQPAPTPTPGTTTPSNPPGTPAPTPPANTFVCAGIESTKPAPKIGESVTFTCEGGGTKSLIKRYQFQYKVDDGAFTRIDVSSSNNAQSVSFPITKPGEYEVQCRACSDSACTKWDSI